MNTSDIFDAAKDIANPEKAVLITSTITDIEKVLNKASREGVRRGYGAGATHGLVIGLGIGGAALIALRKVEVDLKVEKSVSSEDNN